MELLKILATSNSIVEIRKRSKGKIIVLSLGAVMLSLASGIDIAKAESSPTTKPFVTFERVKKFLSDVHEDIEHTKTLYCNCPYVRKGKSGGDIDRKTCSLKARKNETRSDRVEWERVVPASWFGNQRDCWKQGHKLCKTKRGAFKGRKCCLKSDVDSHFRNMHNDPHNLFPASGEIIGDRLKYPFGEVEEEPREYGACDFEVGGYPRVAEPTTSVRGEIARAMLYMKDTYKVDVRMDEETLKRWHREDPPIQWECDRAQKIKDKTNLEGYGFKECGTDASEYLETLFGFGELYREGLLVRKNSTKAAILFGQAAELGFARAQYELGHMYEKGEGVRENCKEARRWFQEAADQGHAEAESLLKESKC